MKKDMRLVQCTVNGKEVAEYVDVRESLLDMLRNFAYKSLQIVHRTEDLSILVCLFSSLLAPSSFLSSVS